MHSYGFMPHDFGNSRFVSFDGRFLKDKDGKLCDSEYEFGGKKLCDDLDVDEDYSSDYSESEGSCSKSDEEYVVVYDSDSRQTLDATLRLFIAHGYWRSKKSVEESVEGQYT